MVWVGNVVCAAILEDVGDDGDGVTVGLGVLVMVDEEDAAAWSSLPSLLPSPSPSPAPPPPPPPLLPSHITSLSNKLT